MDKALFIPSAIVSAILIAIYCLNCIRSQSEVDQKIITNLILQAFQVVCGFVLIGSTFITELVLDRKP